VESGVLLLSVMRAPQWSQLLHDVLIVWRRSLNKALMSLLVMQLTLLR
jgi:hypothetical protein